MLLLKLMWLLVGVARKRNVQATANILSKEMLTGKGTEAEPKISLLYNISYPHNCIALRGLQPSNCRLNQTSSQPLTDLSIDNTGYFKLDHSPPKYIYREPKFRVRRHLPMENQMYPLYMYV